MIEYDNFQKSLKNLELQYENYLTNYQNVDVSLRDLTWEAVAESVIQRFETCYDSLWKVLRRYLREELGIPDVPNSPKRIFQLASENELFSSPIEQWLKYMDARIGTTHDYSGRKADFARELMSDFIDDAIGLYQTMTQETWE